MVIGDLIKRDLISCSPDTKVRDVAKLMKKYDIGGVVIVNEHNQPLGFVTDRDIVVRLISEDGSLDTKVEDIMTRRCIRIKYYADCGEAMRTMGACQVRRIMVVDDEDKVLGVVSLRDLVLYNNTYPRVNITLKNISRDSTQKTKVQESLRVDDYRT